MYAFKAFNNNNNDLAYALVNTGAINTNFEEMDEALDKVQRLIKLESLSYDEISDIMETDKNRILAYPAIYPVTNGESNLSSNFGYRLDPFSKKYRFHGGHDFSSYSPCVGYRVCLYPFSASYCKQ